MKMQGKRVRVSLLLVFGMSITSLLLIFIAISWDGTGVDIIAFHPFLLAAGVALVGGVWFVDSVRLWVSTRAWCKKIPFSDAMGSVLSGYFMAAVTPFSTGGSPAQMYVLTRSGLTWGEVGSLMLITGILYQMSLLVMLFSLIFLFPLDFALEGILLDLLYSFAVAYSILVPLLFFFLLRPQQLHRVVEWGMGFVRRRLKRVQFTDEEVWKLVEEFIVDFQRGFKLFIREKPQYLFWNMACYLCQYLMLFSVAFLVLLALGGAPNYLQVLGAQIPLYYLSSFIPSPGASGGVEISVASVFADFADPEILGVFVLLWRIFTFYFPLLVGGTTFFLLLKKNRILHPSESRKVGQLTENST